jgi:four helix bundle protein
LSCSFQSQRAADSASNNLIEAGNGSTDADFLSKMRLALREAKEARTCLQKISMAPLANAGRVSDLKHGAAPCERESKAPDSMTADWDCRLPDWDS